MMKALFAAISGLQNHITYMDVVGNNIANVNTQGFKASRVTFQDMLTQTISGASAPTETRGGTNPQQVGLGVKIGGVDVLHTQGSLQATGRSTDFAIQGSGFFIMKDANRTFYTRDGAFDLAVSGELVNPTNAYKVQGWRADTNGVVDIDAPLTSIMIPMGQSIKAQESTQVTLKGNLDSGASSVAPADSFSTTVDIYDSLGASHPVTIKYTKTANPREWSVSATSTDTMINALTVDTDGAGSTLIEFDAQGRRTVPAAGVKMEIDVDLMTASGAGVTGTVDFTVEVDHDAITQFAGPGNVVQNFNNGYSAGSLVSFSVGPLGDVTGTFSNGTSRPLGQIAMALFTNPAGLARAGSNNFESTSNAGVPAIGRPSTGGRGSIGAGVLEGSNSDLAREFTNVVIAQRGFQASSRIISTADQMLEGLVNLIR
ncbi:MAG: flagellar hook protein FlgE [Dehalococcoidia bacterium]|nr:MAG: flagellar hook protein FlgE [Dehalococcoidia bacterium]